MVDFHKIIFQVVTDNYNEPSLVLSKWAQVGILQRPEADQAEYVEKMHDLVVQAQELNMALKDNQIEFLGMSFEAVARAIRWCI